MDGKSLGHAFAIIQYLRVLLCEGTFLLRYKDRCGKRTRAVATSRVTKPDAEAPPSGGDTSAQRTAVSGDPREVRSAPRPVQSSVSGAESRRPVSPRLGADVLVLSVPQGALAPSAHHHCRRVAICVGPAPDDGGQTAQTPGVGHGPDLKTVAGRRAELSAPECAGIIAPGLFRLSTDRSRQPMSFNRRWPPDSIYTHIDKISSRTSN